MPHESLLNADGGIGMKRAEDVVAAWGKRVSRQSAIGMVLIVALFAFELFNFDTTRYALADLIGDVNFVGLRWAAILAIAFCAIDFAGLAHLFTPEQGRTEAKEVWYLMGAWLLGATMNALMTWWAINLTLLNHEFGNEVLSRDQLLHVVPPFVAVLVWLTRILFIGAFSVAGSSFFRGEVQRAQPARRPPLVARRGTGDLPARPAAVGAKQRGDNDGERIRRRPPIPGALQPSPSLSASGRKQQRR